MTDTPTPAQPPITGQMLFYSRPEPLSPEAHGKLGVKVMNGPFGFAKSNILPVTVTEFPVAAVTGPIIFMGDDKAPVLVMGLRDGENLFLRSDGMFEPGAYVPAYIRRYPFCFADDTAAQQLVLCIDRAAEFITEDGEMRFFDDQGQLTDYTRSCIEFCDSYEAERRRTISFVGLLKELDLFEVKKATFTPPSPDGSPVEPQPIAEYFGISETKLGALPPEKLAELRDNGALGQIYAHLTSLVGWDRMIAIAVMREQLGQRV